MAWFASTNHTNHSQRCFFSVVFVNDFEPHVSKCVRDKKLKNGKNDYKYLKQKIKNKMFNILNFPKTKIQVLLIKNIRHISNKWSSSLKPLSICQEHFNKKTLLLLKKKEKLLKRGLKIEDVYDFNLFCLNVNQLEVDHFRYEIKFVGSGFNWCQSVTFSYVPHPKKLLTWIFWYFSSHFRYFTLWGRFLCFTLYLISLPILL